LQQEGRVRRAAVVDCDVHQGNGTARLFQGDDSVFTLSLHQQRNYPQPKETSDLDLSFEDGIGDGEYIERLAGALERIWEFGPEIVLYQAGADAYREDQLGGLGLTIPGLEARDRLVLESCARRGIPVAVTMGGGYARRLEDTLLIHLATCHLALALAEAGPAGAAAP
jgi:acetoin utilization deacetylase AcuC-like enzyme